MRSREIAGLVRPRRPFRGVDEDLKASVQRIEANEITVADVADPSTRLGLGRNVNGGGNLAARVFSHEREDIRLLQKDGPSSEG